MPSSPKSLVLALDLGSSSVRSALFTEKATRILATTFAAQYSVNYTSEGGAELQPNELLRAARACLRQTLQSRARLSEIKRTPIVGVCGSGIWHSLLGLDRNGTPTTAVLTWADSRSAGEAAELRRLLSEKRIQRRTGCMLRSPYWPAKLRWLWRTDRALFRHTASWISPATWIFRQLFGVDITSHSMASGSGLYNLRAASWDEELCQLSRVGPAQLGTLRDCCLTSDRRTRELRGLPVFSVIGDGAASNLGSGADHARKIAINIGTSAAVRMIVPRHTAREIPFGLFRYVVDHDRALLGGASSNAGNLRRWFLRELRFADEGEAESALSPERAAADRLDLLPFWVKERGPTWPEKMRGAITGLTPSTTAAEMLRAATTSSYYRLADILERLEVPRGAEIIVSGGVLHSPASLHILADALGRNLRVCRELESSLRGAAVHALESLGYEIPPLRPGRMIRYRPALAKAHRRRRARQHELERRLS